MKLSNARQRLKVDDISLSAWVSVVYCIHLLYTDCYAIEKRKKPVQKSPLEACGKNDIFRVSEKK